MIIFFLILTTLIDQLCDKSIYRPYLRLMTGFMLISLMMQPISYYLSNEDIVAQAISTAVKGENNPAFLDGAKEEKQNQIKEQITTLFSQYDLKVLDVDSKVNEKLDSIKEMQQEMMDFLVQKEKAELKGNLTFLYDVFNNYKYNWNNEMYKNSNHTMVLAIKKEAEAKIVFYREQIIAKVNKKSLIHSDQTVNKQLQAVQDQFKDYQLALYTLAFSSFLDVMLVGNYDKEYLSGISEKLDDYSMKYRELYTQCYEEISGYYSTSIQSSLLKGLSKTTKVVGKIVERIPVVGDTQADETLIAAGEKLGDIGTEKIRKQMRQLIERQSNFVRPFIDNIDTVNRLNNNPVQLLVDKDNLYIATIA